VQLRRKLVLAQAPLALALAIVGVISGLATARLGEEASKILADNYRSLLAAQRMQAALSRIDRSHLARVAGGPEQGGPELAKQQPLLEAALRTQEGNVTEPGEAGATARLRTSWESYRASLARFAAAAEIGARRRVYFEDIGPAFETVKAAIDEIIVINQDAMVRKSERAQSRAEVLQEVVLAAIIGAALLGLIASISLTNRMLRPLGVVASAVRRFGQGDLKARARVVGKDEIAQLAGEFNTMADKLERYRASSLGELLQAQQAAQAAIDGLPDPVVLLDTGGALLGVNTAAGNVLHVDPERSSRDPLVGVDPGVRAVLDRFRTHVVGGKGAYVPKGFEEAIRIGASEGERIFLPRATPIYGEAGEVAGVAVVYQDITRLFRFDELKNNLVATVAHEFRTPLTSLRMAIHLCLEEVVGPLTVKQADLLHTARVDCERLQDIVDDLLNLSRIESGRIDLHKRRATPEALVDQALDVHRAAALERHVTLRAEVPPGCPEVFADPERLQLVFSNLLSNAIRYSPPGAEIVVSASAQFSADATEKDAHRLQSPGSIRFEVKDQGPGIAREHQAGLFEKFFRVPGSPEGGSGLGLFIASGIVQAHGGRIGVESDVGAGATFWFTVPAAPEVVAAAE
jgi:two-component system, NtrC family, sensor histidine kinase KinB